MKNVFLVDVPTKALLSKKKKKKKNTFLSKKALDISCKASIGCLLSFVLKKKSNM